MNIEVSTQPSLRKKYLLAGAVLVIALGLALMEWHLLFSPATDAYATQEKALRAQQQLAMSAERVVTIEQCNPDSDHQCMGIDYGKLRNAAENDEFKVPATDLQ
jgi:hypothetical protein